MKRIKSTLCALIFAATTALAQEPPRGLPPGGGWEEWGGMIGADGRPMRTPQKAPEKKPWDVCGKTFMAQLSAYYDTYPGEHKKLTKEEQKNLERVLIPYAMETRLNALYIDIDRDGKDDYLNFQSETRVPPCRLVENPYDKDNWVQVEFANGKTFYQEWEGDLIIEIDLLVGTPYIKAKMIDEKGQKSYKYLNWKMPVTTKEEVGVPNDILSHDKSWSFPYD